MSQKDYKAIAEINKSNKLIFINNEAYISFCKDQADYFERGDKPYWASKDGNICVPRYCKYYDTSNCKNAKKKKPCGMILVNDFNRKQFLKDCGVKFNRKG